MINFFKHHWSRREKMLAKLGALRAILAALLGLLLATLVILWQLSSSEVRQVGMRHEAEKVDPNQVVPPNTGTIGGPFTLTDQDGKTVTDAQYRGKYMLVYFGYTYCPDLCPTGLQSIAHALDQLGPDAAKVKPIFITIDPARDTPAKLKEYDASFHPDIVGLTGTPEQIASVAKEYQVYYKRGEQVDEHDYIMDHSSLIYLMDPQGKFITTFDEEADPVSIVKTLQLQWAGK
jgi:protein SCO1/2